MKKYRYYCEYDDEYNTVIIPELNGLPIIKRPSSWVDSYELDTDRFYYSLWMEDPDVFGPLIIQKEGGNSQSARATSYYAPTTRAETEAIIRIALEEALGINDDYGFIKSRKPYEPAE